MHIVTITGQVVLFGAALALLGAVLKHLRAGRIAKTPFASPGQIVQGGRAIADAKGAIATEGTVHHGALVTSPISGAACLFYSVEVLARWKVGNEEVKKTVIESSAAVPFAIADGIGQVNVTIDPKAALGVDATVPLNKKKFSRGIVGQVLSKPIEVSPTFSIPPHPTYQEGGRSYGVPEYADFLVTERYLEPKPFLHVNGKMLDDGSIGSPNWINLLVTEKNRDVLLAEARGSAKKLGIGGGLASVVGAAVLAFGLLNAPAPSKAAVGTASVTAAKTSYAPATPGAPPARTVSGAKKR